MMVLQNKMYITVWLRNFCIFEMPDIFLPFIKTSLTFTLYEITPCSYGEYLIFVPYDKLKNYLKVDFKY